MSKVPIACTLSSGDATLRIDEWRDFLTRFVVEVERSATSVRLRLGNEIEGVPVATDLAQREKQCCAFLDFRLLILAGALWLEVATAPDAEFSLDELSFLLETKQIST